MKPSSAWGRLAPVAAAALVCACGDGDQTVIDAASVAVDAARSDNASVRIADASARDDNGSDGGYRPFTVVVLPDTQFYASTYPDIFRAQTDWIVANKSKENIAFVLHLGDIVDDELPGQWMIAAINLHTLDDVVPYILAVGNHDLVRSPDGLTREAPLMNANFPVSRFMRNPWFKGTFEPDQIQNNFALLDGGGRPWLVLSLEFGPRDEVVAWANQILDRYADIPAILITHAYVSRDGSRFHTGNVPPLIFDPHYYGLVGTVNDGEEMWRKLVSLHDNVRFVLSGHDLEPGVARLASVRPSGTRVHEILSNYQTCTVAPCAAIVGPLAGTTTMGGDGYLRLMRFDLTQHTVAVQTYSPYLDRFIHDADNEFTLDLDP